MKVTIFTTKQNRRNLQIEIGGHLVEFDDNLSAVVEEKVATELMELDPSIGFRGAAPAEEVKEEVKHVTEEVIESPEPIVNVNENSVDEVSVSEEDEVDFDSLTLAELKAVAKESNLPTKEWSTLKKVALIEYLQSKL